jgi:hypothetical protein
MTKLTTVAAIGVLLLLGGSQSALAQAASSPASKSVPSEMSAPGTQRAMAMSEEEVRTTLESAGYTSIGDVKADEDGYSATAMKDGKAVKIGVDFDGTIETLN